MSLIVQIRDLKEYPVVLEINHSPAFFELEDDEYSFKENVSGEVTFTLVENTVLSRGWLRTKVHTHCVRCLEEFVVNLDVKVELTYSNDPKLLEVPGEFDALADIINYFDGEIIEPKNELRELIMLELPPLPLCREDCKGLCPNCGANLNKEQCKCPSAEREESKPLADWKVALRQIKPEK